MKLRSLILLLALAWAPIADGQIFNPWPRQQSDCPQGTCPQSTVDFSLPVAAIVRIIADDGRKKSHGSGTLIATDDPRSIVVTCAHLFDANTRSVLVVFSGGKQVAADILYCDIVRELAVLAVADAPNVEPIVLADDPALKGEIVKASGFGGQGERYRTFGGPVIGYAPTKINRGESLMIPGTSRGGDSGGPMLNQRGELVAVLWGTDGCHTRGTYARRIRKILARLFGRADYTPGMVPMQLPPVAETPVEQTPLPSPTPVVDDDTDDPRLDVIEARLAELLVAIAAIPAGAQGERGETGSQGEQGPAGKRGEAGAVATVGIDTLVEAVIEQLLGTDDEEGLLLPTVIEQLLGTDDEEGLLLPLLPPMYFQPGSIANPIGSPGVMRPGNTLYLDGFLTGRP